MDADKELLEYIYKKYGTNNLTECPECKQKTLRIKHSYEYYDQPVTWYRCSYCGYINNSSWSEPLHGKFFRNKFNLKLEV